MSKLIKTNHLGQAIREHHSLIVNSTVHTGIYDIFFKGNNKYERCVQVTHTAEGHLIQTSYFVGVDWLVENQQAIYVAPKINKEAQLDDEPQQVDYLGMLHSCLTHDDIAQNTENLYEIKLDAPFIEIDQQLDLLTPLLFVQFLHLLKKIVSKGLRKSYYKVEENLSSKVKGRVLVAKSIKKNFSQNKPLNTYCSYDVHGLNSVENRVLKHTLVFIRRYLSKHPKYYALMKGLIDFCTPAFNTVSDKVKIREIKSVKRNSFFKEYHEALKLSQIILKRFGYHTSEIESKDTFTTEVPPFWIDMSKLFELHVLGLLQNKYGSKIVFQAKGNYGSPDYLLLDEIIPLIIDAKYKSIYQHSRYDIENIRQISGYARDHKLLEKLGYVTEYERENNVVGCVIIYADQKASLSLPDSLTLSPISQFTKFYKVPIAVPTL